MATGQATYAYFVKLKQGDNSYSLFLFIFHSQPNLYQNPLSQA